MYSNMREFILFKLKKATELLNRLFGFIVFESYLLSFTAACAAASLATGTLNGEHDT